MSTQTEVSKRLTRTIEACCGNAERLLDDCSMLEFQPSGATSLYLAMIAQEELAKAFMLFLIRENIVHLNGAVRQSLHDHRCKQLVGLVMDYAVMHWEEFEELERLIHEDYERNHELAHEAESALVILRYEKIGSWESKSWFFVDDPVYAPSARDVADGAKDRFKQRALYVGVGSDGSLGSQPKDFNDAKPELERAQRYLRLLRAVTPAEDHAAHYYDQRRFDRVLRTCKELFSVRLPGTP